jgi:hypothetical protein
MAARLPRQVWAISNLYARTQYPKEGRPFLFSFTGYTTGTPKSNQLIAAIDEELQKWESDIRSGQDGQAGPAHAKVFHHATVSCEDRSASMSVMLVYPQKPSATNTADMIDCLQDLRERLAKPEMLSERVGS